MCVYIHNYITTTLYIYIYIYIIHTSAAEEERPSADIGLYCSGGYIHTYMYTLIHVYTYHWHAGVLYTFTVGLGLGRQRIYMSRGLRDFWKPSGA